MFINTEKLPIRSWCNNVEDGCIEQAKNLANLPFLYKYVCLMPDTHQGYGMPIGGVIGAKGVVIPNAVGVDIGCGMCAVKTDIKVSDIAEPSLKRLMGKIREVIPVGFNHQKEAQEENLLPDIGIDNAQYPVVRKEYQSALKQLGTLGGGNHFIELQKDQDGFIWAMIHSGSRNLGLKVAKHYNDVAKELNEKWYVSVPKEHDLAFLPIDTIEATRYLEEMNYCLEFALANRKLMMRRVIQAILEVYNDVATGSLINIHHNYAKWENHFGKNLIIHRKGATSARKGELGIIPGSQGTSSYIVKGLGNPDSFMSCSHGAGRRMGRKQAERELNLEDEQKKLNDKGIIHSVRDKGDLDEASGAYKDIDVVMEEQKDLVEIVTKLEPLAVIKG